MKTFLSLLIKSLCLLMLGQCQSYIHPATLFSCSFETEDLCGVTQWADDDLGWIRQASNETDDVEATTGDGHYYLTVNRSSGHAGEKAMLDFPVFDAPGHFCLSYSLFVNENVSGTLEALIMSTSNSSSQTPNIHHQLTEFERNTWFSVQWTMPGSIQNQLYLSWTKGNGTGAIYLDDIVITDEECHANETGTTLPATTSETSAEATNLIISTEGASTATVPSDDDQSTVLQTTEQLATTEAETSYVESSLGYTTADYRSTQDNTTDRYSSLATEQDAGTLSATLARSSAQEVENSADTDNTRVESAAGTSALTLETTSDATGSTIQTPSPDTRTTASIASKYSVPGAKSATTKRHTSSSMACADVDQPCKLGGSCVDSDDGFQCRCPNTTTGKDCGIPLEVDHKTVLAADPGDEGSTDNSDLPYVVAVATVAGVALIVVSAVFTRKTLSSMSHKSSITNVTVKRIESLPQSEKVVPDSASVNQEDDDETPTSDVAIVITRPSTATVGSIQDKVSTATLYEPPEEQGEDEDAVINTVITEAINAMQAEEAKLYIETTETSSDT